jgi:hypothetical protein
VSSSAAPATKRRGPSAEGAADAVGLGAHDAAQREQLAAHGKAVADGEAEALEELRAGHRALAGDELGSAAATARARAVP